MLNFDELHLAQPYHSMSLFVLRSEIHKQKNKTAKKNLTNRNLKRTCGQLNHITEINEIEIMNPYRRKWSVCQKGQVRHVNQNKMNHKKLSIRSFSDIYSLAFLG